jgi:uncharacterized glyoxalase superfamily protein PhnB
MLANRSIPTCTVIPELAYADVADAADWLRGAFGFTVRLRIANHRIQMNVGDGAMVVTERRRGDSSNRPAEPADLAHSVMVRVEDVDRHCRQATAHGARVLNPPTTYPFGERQYSVADPGGHVWTFSQSVADVSPADWGGVAGEM